MATSPGRRCPTCGAPVRWKGEVRVVECRYCQTHIDVGPWRTTLERAQARSLRPSSQRAFVALAGVLVLTVVAVGAFLFASRTLPGASSGVEPTGGAATADGGGRAGLPEAGASSSATAGPSAAPSAPAQQLVRPVLEFGEQGNGPGQFDDPRQIVVTPSGDILVADYRSRRVQRFDGTGRFLELYRVRRGRQGESITGLAADYDGNFWVTVGGDLFKYRIETGRLLLAKLSQAPKLSYGAMVVAPDNTVYVQNFGASASLGSAASRVDNLRKLSKYGRLLERWREVASGPMTVDARGTIYVAAESDPRIDVIDVDGELSTRLGGRQQADWGIGVIAAVAADSRGRLFVLAGDVHVLTTTGERLGRFSSKGARALAVDAAGAIYSVTSYARVIKYEVLGTGS